MVNQIVSNRELIVEENPKLKNEYDAIKLLGCTDSVCCMALFQSVQKVYPENLSKEKSKHETGSITFFLDEHNIPNLPPGGITYEYLLIFYF